MEEFDPETGELLTPEDPAPQSGMDFHLSAREAAEYVSESFGYTVSASTFRHLVMTGAAPKPLSGNDFKAVWSQAALSTWATEQIEATAIEGEPEGEGAEEVPTAEAQHQDVYEFFEKTFSPYYELHDASPSVMNENSDDVLTWCKQWWLHKSVVARLVAAWYAWEDAFSAGGGAMSSWILEHGDRHYERIMADTGPFEKCSSEHTEDMGEYPTEECPPALRLQDDENTDENKETQQ